MTDNSIIQDALLYSEHLDGTAEERDIAYYAYIEGCKRQLLHDTRLYMELDRLIRKYEELLSVMDDPEAEKEDEFRTMIDSEGNPRLPHTYERYPRTEVVRGVELEGRTLRKIITENFGRNMNWMQSYLEDEDGAVKYCLVNWESVVYEQVMGVKKLRLEYKELRLGKTIFEELLSRVESVRRFMMKYLEEHEMIPPLYEVNSKGKKKSSKRSKRTKK